MSCFLAGSNQSAAPLWVGERCTHAVLLEEGWKQRKCAKGSATIKREMNRSQVDDDDKVGREDDVRGRKKPTREED